MNFPFVVLLLVLVDLVRTGPVRIRCEAEAASLSVLEEGGLSFLLRHQIFAATSRTPRSRDTGCNMQAIVFFTGSSTSWGSKRRSVSGCVFTLLSLSFGSFPRVPRHCAQL